MKKMKRLTALLCLLLALTPTLLHAQVVDVCAGDGTDSVTLSVGNYQYGNIQWQISEDTLTWTDIPGANDTVYRFKPEGNETRYYRAWMQYPNCPDESSAVTRVQFQPNANAGPDRVLNEDFVTTLFGNRVEDEGVRCMWQVIEGDSANLEDPTYCNSRFSGPDTLYKLTWTVANACGVSVDTVEIRYVHTVMYDAIAIVDTTDIILSDSAEMASGFYRIVFSNPVPNITDSTILMGMDGDDFLRRVIDFEWFGDTCEIYASPADFLDILVEGAINFEIPLNFNDTNQRRGLRHIYTRAELMNDPRFVSGQWNNLFQEWFRDSYESGTRGPRSIIGSDYVELSSHFQIRDFNPYFSENTLYGADHYKDNNGTLHAFVCLIGDWHTDFTLRLKDGSASVTIDVPTSASVDIPNPFRPNKTIASLGLYIPIVFTGSVQSQNWVDIPVRVTTPISVMGSYHGNPKKFWRIMRDLDYRNESELPTIEATEPDLNGNSFECTLEFKVGAKLGLSFLEDKVGLWFNVLPTLSYSICLGSNGFKSQTVSSYVKATVTGELWFVGVDFDDIWSATWGYSSWHTPYKVTTTTNRNLDIPTDGSYISEPVQVQVFNQDNRPVKSGKKVLFESTDGVVSSIPSGNGSASAFATTDINGIAQIYWKPNNVQNSVLKASVLDCNGNHINGSPLFFYTDCYHSTLSLRIVDDRLSASGGDGAYSFLFFQYSADNINWTYSPNELYPLVPGTTYFVKDNNGCKAATTYTVQESTPDCNLGLGAQQDGLDVVIMVNNGIPPFHYYVDGVDQTPDGYDGRRKRFTFTEGGEHNFSVTDDDGFGCNSGTFSVRLSDGITVPIVSTSTTYNRVHNVYDQVMGAITDNGGAPILERGVQWSLSSDMSNATNVTSSFTGDGLGRFVCNISGVSAGTTYYARAYATNSKGPGYGAVIPITVPGSAPTGSTNSCNVNSIRSNETGSNGTITAVRDHQNNSYAVVQIGNQCWLKENMRCTTSPTTGANIVQNPASGSSSTVRRAYYYDNNPSNAANGCGLLYNWFAAVDGLDVESSRGICPEGWHVPTDAEWTTMMNAAVSIYQPGTTPNPEFGSLNMNSEFEGINTLISQLLSDSSRAKWTNLLAMIELYYQEGYMTADTYNGYMNYFLNPNFLGNATGFSAFPAGLYSSSNFSQDRGASFWSSSQSSSQYGSRVWTREFYYIMPGVQRWAQDKGIAMSVRCLRNSDGYVMPTGDRYPCQNAPTVTDIDNNTYFTVQIGNQCWMKENLRTTRYSDGTNIPEGDTNSYSQPHRYFPNEDEDNVETYGYLYNWSAVMHGSSSSATIPSGVQGVCPTGWHVPSSAEWMQLTNYVENQSQYICGTANTNIAKALASTEGWRSSSGDDCLVGYVQADNNATGFSSFPAGRYSEGIEYADFRHRAHFWSSTEGNVNTARGLYLYYQSASVTYQTGNKNDARSVRCLQDADNGNTPNPPSPTSCRVSSIRSNETGGNDTITAVQDHENNSYAVVQIGSQCWLKENMRCTTSPSTGANMVQNPANGTSSTVRRAYYYDNNPANAANGYGLLYNWPASMDGSTMEGARGICPEGWHLPADAEWTQLTSYVSSQSQYVCGSDNTYIAKALAATSGWNSFNSLCTVGNEPSTNNATGFSALPSGVYLGNYYALGNRTDFWSATQIYGSSAYRRNLNSSSTSLDRYYNTKDDCYSVRCLRNDEGMSAAVLPTVSTSAVGNVTSTTATCGGNVTSDGGANVTERGVCWSTSQNPTISDNHTIDGSGVGGFISNISGLTAGVTYYVRAYATNSVGTAYGDEVSLTVPGSSNVDEVVVSFNGSTWVAADILLVEDHSTDGYITIAIEKTQRCSRNNSDAYLMGFLKNTTGSWTYSSSGGHYCLYRDPSYIYRDVNGVLGNAGAVYWGWNEVRNSFVENITEIDLSNMTISGSFSQDFFDIADYIAAGNTIPSNRKTLTVTLNNAHFNDTSAVTGATVTTTVVSNITPTSATCGGNVTSDGGANVTARGVCWSTHHNPTISDSHTTDGSGMGSFISSVTGLFPNTTYYVRAYAVNSIGTRYGNEVSFTTSNIEYGQPCPNATTVTDIDGNTYNTVQIGNQCWMKENLRTTHYADGTGMSGDGNQLSANMSSFLFICSDDPFYYVPNRDFSRISTFGYMYNYAAVMHGESPTEANPSSVQGICPTGWHVPSEAEWTQLVDYLSNHSQYLCDGNNANVAKAMSAISLDWDTISNTCAVGDDLIGNNTSGFSALPAGRFYSDSYLPSGVNCGTYQDFSKNAFYWTATNHWSAEEYLARGINISYNNANVLREPYSKMDALSVRCLRD